MRVWSEEVRKSTNMETIREQVRRRRRTWTGHMLQMDNSSLPRATLTWAPEVTCGQASLYFRCGKVPAAKKN